MSQIIQIPLENGAPPSFFDMQVPLEGVTYTLQFRWNVIDSAWRLHVLNEAGTVVLRAGLKLVANWPLGAYAATHHPPGALLVVDSAGENKDPTLEEFGVRYKLLYLTAAELGL